MVPNDVEQQVIELLEKHNPYVMLNPETYLFRVQETRYESPVFYNDSPESDSRWAHKRRAVGVCYLGCSPELAVLEVFKHGKDGQGTPVLASDVDESSLHRLETSRVLKLVDAGELSRRMGFRPHALIEEQGMGSKGYSLTQSISAACSEYGTDIDGVAYLSSVYSPAGAPEAGRNVVLFTGRGEQVIAKDSKPLAQVQLRGGVTVKEFLEDMQIDLE